MTQQELAEAIQAEVDEFSREHEYIPPGDALSINSGHCRVFVESLLSRLNQPANVELCSAGCHHTWLVRDGRYFDAERPRGVDDPTELPIWERLTHEEYQSAADCCPHLPAERYQLFQ